MKNSGISNWAFLIGAIVAVLVGIGQAAQASYATNQWIPVVLVVLGLIVGFLNVTGKETTNFLVATIALVALSSGGVFGSLDTLIPRLGVLLVNTLQAFTFFIGAAAVVVAVKEAWALAKGK